DSLPRLRIERRPASVDPNVATALRPPEFLESVPECRHVGMWSRIVLGKAHQHADAPHELALLRVRCDRPRSHPTNQCNELARPHSSPPRLRSRILAVQIRLVKGTTRLSTSVARLGHIARLLTLE